MNPGRTQTLESQGKPLEQRIHEASHFASEDVQEVRERQRKPLYAVLSAVNSYQTAVQTAVFVVWCRYEQVFQGRGTEGIQGTNEARNRLLQDAERGERTAHRHSAMEAGT